MVPDVARQAPFTLTVFASTLTKGPAATMRPSSFLAQIHADYVARGWEIDDLSCFRMEVATAPTIPDELGDMSDDELASLLAAVTDYVSAVDGQLDADGVQILTDLADGVDRVVTEQGARAQAAAELAAAQSDLLARLTSATTTETDDEGEPEAEPVAEAEPEPVAAAAARPLPTPRKPAPLAQQIPAAPVTAAAAPIRPPTTIVAAADVPGVAPGAELVDMRAAAEALIAKRESIGRLPIDAADGQNLKVASFVSLAPEERFLRRDDDRGNRAKILSVVGPDAIAASGGICNPVQPYYDVMVLANASRPVRDAFAGFTADRGGIRFMPPPRLSVVAPAARSVTDGATNTNTTVTSATAAFDARDVGATISGTGIPAGAYIVSVESATSVTISAAATATATGVTITVTRRGAVGKITAAQDLAALNGTTAQIVAATKPFVHVTCPSQVEVDIAAIAMQLEFGNFTARAWPEQVDAWIALGMAQHARAAETALLDRLAATATAALTAASTMGAARDIVGQMFKATSAYRNTNRMDPQAPLRVVAPAWLIDAMCADLTRGSGYEAEFFDQVRAEVNAALAEINVRVSWYIDSGTGKGQMFNSGNFIASGTLPAFPTTCVWYLFAEGSYLFLDGGRLDFGLVRDSSLINLNNYRTFFETFEELAFIGLDSWEITSTIAANGTFAGSAYGSNTQSSPVAIPSSY